MFSLDVTGSPDYLELVPTKSATLFLLTAVEWSPTGVKGRGFLMRVSD